MFSYDACVKHFQVNRLSLRFVVGAATANFINLIILTIANTERRIEPVTPILEEKNGAIMLY